MGFTFGVIGGGIIGLSIARKLRESGAEVAVIDRGPIGAEASWAAAGMLAPNAETFEDGPFFRFCTASNALYPEFAAQLMDETGIDVELDRAGTLYLSFDKEGDRHVGDKYAWRKGAGIEVELLSAEDIRKVEPEVSGYARSALFYPNDWQVENRKLVAALRRSCELRGVQLFENTEVTGLLRDGERIIGATTGDGEIRAERLIVACGAWSSGVLGFEVVKPIRGQMIALSGGPRSINSVIYSHRGYVVPRADGRVLVGATVEDAGFRKEVLAESVDSLREAALEIAPTLANFDIREAWAGLRPCAADGLPIIGPVPGAENLFVATGHHRNGILLAPITAEVVARALLGKEHSEYLSAFGPERFVSASGSVAVPH